MEPQMENNIGTGCTLYIYIQIQGYVELCFFSGRYEGLTAGKGDGSYYRMSACGSCMDPVYDEGFHCCTPMVVPWVHGSVEGPLHGDYIGSYKGDNGGNLLGGTS